MPATTLFYLLVGAVVMAVIAGIGIFWAIRSSQFDDLEGPAQRILMDDDDPMIPRYRRLNDKPE
jgi:cbb3-type cytochrome oxidase maturation protein